MPFVPSGYSFYLYRLYYDVGGHLFDVFGKHHRFCLVDRNASFFCLLVLLLFHADVFIDGIDL